MEDPSNSRKNEDRENNSGDSQKEFSEICLDWSSGQASLESLRIVESVSIDEGWNEEQSENKVQEVEKELNRWGLISWDDSDEKVGGPDDQSVEQNVDQEAEVGGWAGWDLVIQLDQSSSAQEGQSEEEVGSFGGSQFSLGFDFLHSFFLSF